MNPRFKRLISLTALLLALAIGQMILPVSLAGPGGDSSVLPHQATAILTTRSNNPVMVNGANSITGATIMSGAGIETPDQVVATVNLPNHFSLEIEANAKVSVDFDVNGIKVNVIKGCVVLRTKKGTTGEIDTANGVAGRADGSKDARLEICDPTIAAAPAAAAAGTGGLSQTGGVLIGAAGMGAALLIPIIGNGRNPSPGNP
jgi:hypothetical protein